MSSRSFSKRLIDAFHDRHSPDYRRVDAVVWTLIAISIVLLVIEALAPSAWLFALGRIEGVVLLVFSIELLLRVLTFQPPELAVFDRTVVERIRLHLTARLRYLLMPLSLIDALTILSFFPALRGLRALRLLRLLRSTKIFRYANPFEGILRAMESDRLLFTFAFSVLGLQAVLGGISLYLVERGRNEGVQSLGDGLWWAIVTLTTVGFGDITPATELGRVIGAALMVGGMFTLALFAGIVGHSLLHAILTMREEQFRMGSYFDHIVVCGYSEGTHLLLDALGKELDLEKTRVVLFADRERPHELPPKFHWVRGDSTKESELDKVRLTHASTIILAGERGVPPQQADATTILRAFTIRKYIGQQPDTAKRRRPLYIVGEILDSENVGHARRAGVDEVIETHRVGFSMITHAILFPGTADVMSRVVSAGRHSVYVARLPQELGDEPRFGDLAAHIETAFPALVLGVRDPATGESLLDPPKDLRVSKGSHVVYLATSAVLESP